MKKGERKACQAVLATARTGAIDFLMRISINNVAFCFQHTQQKKHEKEDRKRARERNRNKSSNGVATTTMEAESEREKTRIRGEGVIR